MTAMQKAEVKSQFQGFLDVTTRRALILSMELFKKSLRYKRGRDIVLKKLDEKMQSVLLSDTRYPYEIRARKSQFLQAMFHRVKENIDNGNTSVRGAQRLLETLGINHLKNETIREEFRNKYGMLPPWFITFSPTQRCNLNCTGCYASAKANAAILPFKIVEKITKEVREVWGNNFMTISGGEPLMYKDGEKTLFDLWEKYDDMTFMFYTNGTLITKGVAQRLAKLGNVIPAISIEGNESHTDERRGKGVHNRVLEAMKFLREEGVPFAVSVTATAKNVDVLLKDEFYDELFEKQGALLMWMFHLMPIGQARDMKELMVTPKQRVKLYQIQKHLVKDKGYPIADFWNSGFLAGGCIAYGSEGGYLYIDWNGKIMPCVFVPYYEDTVFDMYAKKKGITDALFSDLFVRGREWQNSYGLSHTQKPCNWLMPCSIRDHWSNFRENILTEKSKPEDECAAEALKSKKYTEVLDKFDENLGKLTDPIWDKEFLKKKK